MKHHKEPSHEAELEDDARHTEMLARNGVVIVRAYRRDPNWNGWSFKPEIIFDRPVDVMSLFATE
jgi:hypothetical protein